MNIIMIYLSHFFLFYSNYMQKPNKIMLLIRNLSIRRFLPSKSFCIQVFSAGALAMTGDMICQKLVEKREQLDTRRTARFALTTMLAVAPIQFVWFRFLENRIKANNANTRGRILTGLKRVIIDQGLCAPFLNGIFLFTLNFMDSFSTRHAFQRTKRTYRDIMVSNYKYWPYIQFVNLTVIPLHFRVVFLQFFAIFWTIYLSYKANN